MRIVFFILVALSTIVIAWALLIYFDVVETPRLPAILRQTSPVEPVAEYKNPLDKATQYTNPFSKYKNPFETLK